MTIVGWAMVMLVVYLVARIIRIKKRSCRFEFQRDYWRESYFENKSKK